MDQIRNYVDTMFSSLPDTETVREMKRNILANMQEHYEELLSQGIGREEALNTVISQFGSIDEIKKELGMEEEPEKPRHYGFLETFFAYFSPETLLFRSLVRRNPAEAAILFLSVAAYLALGFTRNLWHPGWLILFVPGLIILMLQHRKNATAVDFEKEIQAHSGILEFVFAYFCAPVLFWQILIRRNAAEAVIFFSALAVHLTLGFTLNLWPVSWIVFPAAGFVIFLRRRYEESHKKAFGV